MFLSGGCSGALVSETFDVPTGVLFRAATIFGVAK